MKSNWSEVVDQEEQQAQQRAASSTDNVAAAEVNAPSPSAIAPTIEPQQPVVPAALPPSSPPSSLISQHAPDASDPIHHDSAALSSSTPATALSAETSNIATSATQGIHTSAASSSDPPSNASPGTSKPDAIAQLSSSMANSQLNIAIVAQDEDDALPIATYQGLHPNDATASVSVVGQGQAIYQAATLTTFEQLGLSKELLNGIYEMKFTSPSKIQAQALPILLGPTRPSMIGQAHHGSGKTATFALAILSRIQISLNKPQAIVVVPTRELAIQVTKVVASLAKFTSINVFTAIPTAVKERSTEKQSVTAHVVVGTPGKLESKLAHHEIDSSQVKMFVADEADQMISVDGMIEQTMKIKKRMPRSAQILLFSATFDTKTRAFAKTFAPNAIEIAVKTEELSLSSIKQFVIDCGQEQDKYGVLISMYSSLEIGQSIIFVHSVATAKQLANQMRRDGYTVSLLHGKDMPAEERDRVMLDFRQQRATVLITTNVLARGIDVLSVTLVVNFDIPLDRHNQPDSETYIHRIGRSGRFGRKGVAINLVASDKSKQDLRSIATHFNMEIIPLPKNDQEACATLVQKALAA